MIAVRYEGLRELAQALRIVNHELYEALVAGLGKAGEVIREDAAARFVAWGNGDPTGSAASAAGFQKGAAGFKVLVRPNTSTMAILSVAQTLRRTTDMRRRRSNMGDLQMRKALLLARSEKMVDAVTAVDDSVATLLHSHGF